MYDGYEVLSLPLCMLGLEFLVGVVNKIDLFRKLMSLPLRMLGFYFVVNLFQEFII